MRLVAAAALFAVLAAFLGAGDGQAQMQPRVTIGYLELSQDPRYDERRAYAGLLLSIGGHPFDGAELALQEAAVLGRMLKVDFALQRAEAADTAGLVAAVQRLTVEQAVHFFLLDAPADIVAGVAAQTAGKDVALFNVSASDDTLRGAACAPHLFHLAPSQAMLMDALAQFLVAKHWTEALVLQGPLPEDARLVEAFQRAAARFGVEIVDVRSFLLGNDPRQRDQNNVALLTADADYDTVFVADSDGEFARALPYQTMQPRPVVGSAGLTPTAWHWAWERHGGPQLTRRFEGKTGRAMQAADWAAWVGVKAIVEAVTRTNATDFPTLRAYLESDRLRLDGYKGAPLSFRPWDHQLRQPIFLGTQDWVVERAPLTGFLHQTNNLDTLGVDAPETACRMAG